MKNNWKSDNFKYDFNDDKSPRWNINRLLLLFINILADSNSLI